MASSLFTQAIMDAVEKGFNKLLKMDAVATEQLATLEGKVLAIQSTAPSAMLYLTPTEQGIFLTTEYDIEADSKLIATTPLLLQLFLAREKEPLLENSEIMIVGEIAIILQFFKILEQLNPDWEYELSQWIGPMPASLIVQSLKTGAEQLHNGFNLIQNQLATFFSSTTSTMNNKDKIMDTNPIVNVMDFFQKKFGQP